MTRHVRRVVPDSEIHSAIKLVFGTEPDEITCAVLRHPRRSFDLESLQEFAADAPADISDEFFIARSKYPVDRSPLFALSKLYEPGERILIFDKYKSQGQFMWQHRGEKCDFFFPGRFTYNRSGDGDGVWFLSGPLDGRYHPNPRTGNKASRRSEEPITRYPYIVLENDEAPRELWLRALALLPLLFVMITDSGGSSVHALVKSYATTKDQWEENVSEISSLVTILGAVPGALTAVRLTRLPNCWRRSKQREQRLLYLNDDADDTPLIERASVTNDQNA
jgi:hypothetical protein